MHIKLLSNELLTNDIGLFGVGTRFYGLHNCLWKAGRRRFYVVGHAEKPDTHSKNTLCSFGTRMKKTSRRREDVWR